jgi:hypothetical protein
LHQEVQSGPRSMAFEMSRSRELCCSYCSASQALISWSACVEMERWQTLAVHLLSSERFWFTPFNVQVPSMVQMIVEQSELLHSFFTQFSLSQYPSNSHTCNHPLSTSTLESRIRWISLLFFVVYTRGTCRWRQCLSISVTSSLSVNTVDVPLMLAGDWCNISSPTRVVGSKEMRKSIFTCAKLSYLWKWFQSSTFLIRT